MHNGGLNESELSAGMEKEDSGGREVKEKKDKALIYLLTGNGEYEDIFGGIILKSQVESHLCFSLAKTFLLNNGWVKYTE